MTVRFDHAVYAVRDLDAAADRWLEVFGLASHSRRQASQVGDGEPHRSARAGVPRADRGRRPGGRRRHGPGPDAAGAHRSTGTDGSPCASPTTTSRPRRPGSASRSSPGPGPLPMAASSGGAAPGSTRRSREPWLPFFIAWDVPAELHPGRAAVGGRADVEGIVSAEVAGDAGRLDRWLDGAPGSHRRRRRPAGPAVGVAGPGRRRRAGGDVGRRRATPATARRRRRRDPSTFRSVGDPCATGPTRRRTRPGPSAATPGPSPPS